MSRLSLGGGRWRCDECRMEGTFAELSAVACPAAKVGPLSPEEQLAAWVEGRPTCPNSQGECCPDFSCCRPTLLAPEAVRRAFQTASQDQRERLLLSFLDGVVTDVGVTVHVTRGRPEEPS